MVVDEREGSEPAALAGEGHFSRPDEAARDTTHREEGDHSPKRRKSTSPGIKEQTSSITRPVPVRRPFMSDGRSRAVDARLGHLQNGSAQSDDIEFSRKAHRASGLNQNTSHRHSAWTRLSPVHSESPPQRSLSPEEPQQDHYIHSSEVGRARHTPTRREKLQQMRSEELLKAYRREREAELFQSRDHDLRRTSEDTDSMGTPPVSPNANRRSYPDRAQLAELQTVQDMQDECIQDLNGRNLRLAKEARLSQDLPNLRPQMPRKMGLERCSGLNGSLNILSEDDHSPVSEHRGGGSSYFLQARPAGNPRLDLARAQHDDKQMRELLAETIRNHGPQLNSPLVLGPEGAMLPGRDTSLPVGAQPFKKLMARYDPESILRNNSPYGSGLDLDMYKIAASRRWNSCGSLPDGLHPSASAGLGSNLPPNLSGSEYQALMQALQQKHQASEMDSLANFTIQAILSGSANREISLNAFPRGPKRKLADFHEPPYKRHSSALSEAEVYNYSYSNGHQQMCAECGATSTPTWRRCGKNLMCNACGLRRSRSQKNNARLHGSMSNLRPLQPLPTGQSKNLSKRGSDISEAPNSPAYRPADLDNA